jgi:putative tricarboxylic transport membrane protein
MPRRIAAGELALAAAIVALGLFFLIDAQAIKVAPIYARIGPRFFPTVVGAGLCVVGVLLAIAAVRGGWRSADDASPPDPARTDWLALILISAGLLQQALLMKYVGFVPTTAVLFFLVALGFGSRRYLRDAVIAIVLSVLVFFVFTAGLKLSLPGIPTEALF